tara:strand:+ start:314 stop:601 length:288 start_codon:yes stop_codon:yes gene_type:complete
MCTASTTLWELGSAQSFNLSREKKKEKKKKKYVFFILPFLFHNDKSQQYFYQSEKFTDGTYFVHASVWLWLFRYQLRTHELVYICIQQWLFLSTK